MKVFPGTFVTGVGFHVQRVVCVVVVVVGVLRMHRQMRHLTGALRHRHRAEHRHGLPHQDQQKKECAQANRHAINCNSAFVRAATRMKVCLE